VSAAQQGGYPDMSADPVAAAVESRELAARVMLSEYEQLKEEQRSRISIRDNLVYAVLIASAAVASATVANGSVYLLLLPTSRSASSAATSRPSWARPWPR
jgi:hypothetical protein